MSKLFFGRDGKKIYSRRSLLYDNERNYYDSSGKKIGYSRPSYFMPGQTNYYDRNGKKVGYSHKSYLYDNQTNYYNNSHEKQGTSRKSYLYDDVNVYHDRKHSYKGFDVKPIIDPYPDKESNPSRPKMKNETPGRRTADVHRSNVSNHGTEDSGKGNEGFSPLSVLDMIILLMIIIGAILG